MSTGASNPTPEALAHALEAARGELLGALQGLTERDFATELAEGVTIVSLLADLARAEHAAIAQARTAAGLAPRAIEDGGTPAARPLPPQVTHALAGTRYEARLLLDALPPRAAVEQAVARALLEGVAAAEHDAATRIAARPPGSDAPPPVLKLV